MLPIINRLNDFLDRWPISDRASLVGGIHSLIENKRVCIATSSPSIPELNRYVGNLSVRHFDQSRTIASVRYSLP